MNSVRKGYSLLEVVLAASLCATALVPALALVRDSMTLADTIDKRHLLLLYGVAAMEEQLSVVAATWNLGTTSGDFASEGHPNVRYVATCSDDPANGGVLDQLMNVTVAVYSDDNGNDLLDSTELQTVLTTKVAKLLIMKPSRIARTRSGMSVDQQRMLLSIDGVIAPIPESGEKYGVQVDLDSAAQCRFAAGPKPLDRHA